MIEQEREEGVVIETWAREKWRKGKKFWPEGFDSTGKARGQS
jgi:hypothetical protein